jgi:hypothetical protein
VEEDMGVFVVAYDLSCEAKRLPIAADIQAFPAWARISETSYAIDTDLNCKEIKDHLERHLDQNDRLYVIALRRPYAGWGPTEVDEWFLQRLPHAGLGAARVTREPEIAEHQLP